MNILLDQLAENRDKARSRRPAPVCRMVRLVGMVGPAEQRCGEVEIGTKRYYLLVSATTFTLRHHDGRRNKVYTLPVDCSGCDCEDRRYRPGKPFCRHMLAMRELVDDGMVPTIS